MSVRTRPRRTGIVLAALLAANVVAMLGSFLIGRFSIDVATLSGFIWDSTVGDGWAGPANVAHVVLSIRLPRIVAAILIGAALSVAGAAYQSLFRNPLVSPDILGASSGAGFGASVAIIVGAGTVGLQISAFVGALIAVLAAWTLSRLTSRDQILALVLGGIVVSALFTAGTSILKYVADTETQLPAITFWLMGGLNGVRVADLAPLAIPIVVCVGVLWLVRWRLDTITFGDETATALGVNVTALRTVVIVCATLLTGVAVAVGGVIGWVGLIVPHLARMLFGPEHRALLPAAALIGALFLLGVDTIARTLIDAEIPLGILTALVGAPFLAFLLARNKSW